ncbi:peptidase domain-containing ABC transporter [Alteromonas oceanisediminis]|uniref:peptidase domain-containing ABC transporter n=1 Tax=Alteromonas oceanisediminis TaxID=2836180 RepID=UPI001BDA868A|nr:peptidase domain-containing ABC transporter [Alteromonas oceanisediminis]MBT0587719.1 peptidase domain-containing ABC transporter [Alteromonas oceanisediminis]
MLAKSLSASPRAESLLRFVHRRTLPLIVQTEAAECGLACVAMVAGYHGLHTDLTRLRHRFSISAHGATLKQIMSVAEQLSLTCRGLKLDLEHLPQLSTPCILHWEMKHFVVLKRCHKNAIVIHDPAVGERRIPLSEVDKSFTGVALELTPNESFTPKKDKQRLTIQHFWSNITGIKRSLGVVLALSLLLQVFAIVSPYYMQTVIDDVILRSDTSLLTVLALGFGLLLLIETGTTVLRRITILHLSSKLSIQMASNVFHHLIRLPMDYFAKRHMGDVVSRFSSLGTIRELLTTGLVAVVIDGLMALITLCVMFVYDSTLAFIVVGVVLLYALLRFFLYRPIRLLNEEAILASAKENSHFMESVRAAQTIKLFGQESERQHQWLNTLAKAMNKKIQIARWDIGFGTANQLLFGLENILIVFFAALAVMSNAITVGMLFAFVSYKSRFISAMDGLIAKWIEFKMLDLHFDRLADIVFTTQDPMLLSNDSITHPINTQKLTGELVAENASFSYSTIDAPTFSQLNLRIHAGETLAIVGPSGSGKTTLLKCLMGLFALSGGRILIDGTDIKEQPAYRYQIAAVLQDDQLLSGSIADNIACFDDKVDLERVVWAAHMACVHDDIVATSMQYNTLVGDMGTSLSGGQKQRILLARALYRQPTILFLDEATSHLDMTNENRVNQHLKQLNITRVVVAHRLHTIKTADRIVEIADGRLAEKQFEQLGHYSLPQHPGETP